MSLNILHIDASGRQQGSISRSLTAQIAKKVASEHTNATIVYRDLIDSTVPFVNELRR